MQTLTKEDLDINATANIKFARAQLKLTQIKFAKALQANPKTIGAIEEGRTTPSPHLIYRLSLLIKVSLQTLYFTKLSDGNAKF
ncbi:helix-turn-helix transcriptional regulator [Mucilaginibacter sp. 10I4]|uniref:helix-turn-helix transcriptional regulator n=1 Tax=Mucilaginibacter sp. 10I4 TaxID=3048580 RepID=UPI002B237A40|nr:helix-turn-helix transcriptional regulator [Mucilaginibacter sp. 10I4]MEB0262875.1 helix-turn-helix transcriptional regulator [Mucilaginibacter sp. 10I4]